MPDPDADEPEEGDPGTATVEEAAAARSASRLDGVPRPAPTSGDEDEPIDGFVIAPDAYSASAS